MADASAGADGAGVSRRRRWAAQLGMKRDQHEFDPPHAPGIYPWLLLLSGPIWDTAHGRSHPLWLAIGGVIAFGAAWIVTVHYAFETLVRGSAKRLVARAALGVVMVLALALAVHFRNAWSVLPPAAGIAIGVTVRGAAIVTVAAPFTAATAILSLLAGASLGDTVSLTWGTFASASIPWIIIRLFAAIAELRRTREQLAEAAVERERTRFSRDLHDLLGHTLSVMVVKAEAVRRLLPAHPDGAIAQAVDIEQLGRQALVEVREAVTGYRGRGLTAELDAARAALSDAGIEPTVRVTTGTLAAETDALLGWAVREATTNVIRHSGATSCSIEVTITETAVLEVIDNGSRGVPPGPCGNGLLGLRERVEAQGGRLEAGPAPGGGFWLRVSVQAQARHANAADNALAAGAA